VKNSKSLFLPVCAFPRSVHTTSRNTETEITNRITEQFIGTCNLPTNQKASKHAVTTRIYVTMAPKTPKRNFLTWVMTAGVRISFLNATASDFRAEFQAPFKNLMLCNSDLLWETTV